jgi:HEAT repeat protein
METAELILEYVKALVWPAVFLFLLFRFRGSIKQLVDRVVDRSTEISGSAFGFQGSVRLHDRMADLAQKTADASPDVREAVKDTAADLIRDEFRALSSNFYGAPLQGRQEAARAISHIATSVELDDLLEFARSPVFGERCGAAIALGEQARVNRAVCDNPEVKAAVGDLLGDENSRVRYRAVEAAGACPGLLNDSRARLQAMADGDTNGDVRKRARQMLARS